MFRFSCVFKLGGAEKALPVFFDVARGLFDVVVKIVVEFFRRFFALRKIVLLERVFVGVFGYSHQFQVCHTVILSRFRAVRKRFRALSLFKTYSLYPLFLRFVGVFVSVCADFLIFAAFNEKNFSINFSKPIDRGGGLGIIFLTVYFGRAKIGGGGY